MGLEPQVLRSKVKREKHRGLGVLTRMELYLVQHGEAKPEQEDPARPLSERGREEVQRVARYAARLGLKVAEIRHSGKLRAEQTAQILAEALAPSRGVRKAEGLAPLDDPAPRQEELERLVEEGAEGLMLVGHLPHLSRLAGLLLVGDPERELIRFRMGGIVCFSREREEEGWAVKWILVPELVV